MLKKISLSIWTLFLVIGMNMSCAFGASYSIRASKSTVSPGESFTVSVGGDVTGKFNISVSNGSANKRSVWVENGYQTISIKAGSSGKVTVIATPEVGLSDVNGDPVSASSRSTSVSIRTSQSSSSNSSSSQSSHTSPTVKEDTRSKNNFLSSLSVKSGNLTPQFSKNQTTYKISLPAETTEIEINAKAEDSKAKVSGTGKKSVEAGKNNFVVTCTAENGQKKMYNIEAIVDDTPLVFVEYNGKKLGVVRNFEGVDAPEGFTETSVEIKGKKTKAWTNKKIQKTIISLQEEKTKHFYLYENGQVISLFQYIGVKGTDLYVLDVLPENQKRNGMKYTQVRIEGEDVYAWTFNDSSFENYVLIYAMNTEGEKDYYQYETTMNTIQLYSKAAPVTEKEYNQLTKQKNTYMILMIVFMIMTLGLASAIGYYKFIYLKKKNLVVENDDLEEIQDENIEVVDEEIQDKEIENNDEEKDSSDEEVENEDKISK